MKDSSATNQRFPRSGLSLAVTALCSALFVTSASTAATGIIRPALYLSTIMDSQQPQYIDGPVPAARSGFLKSMASDSKGNLFFSDATSHAIRQISMDGIVRTLTDEVLFNIEFMAVDSNDQLYFLQVFDLFRGNPNWEVKRLLDNGDTELIASGDGVAFGFHHDLRDGFYVYVNRSYYDDIQHEFIRISGTGTKQIVYDTRVRGGYGYQRPPGRIFGTTVDNNGNLLVLDGLMLRRIYDNGVLQDIASFSPGIGTLARDIAFTEANQIVLCTQNQLSVWDLSTYQLVYLVGDAPFSIPGEEQALVFPSIRRCQTDAAGNINVMHMNGIEHNTLSRIHTTAEPFIFPALHSETDFRQMLHNYAAGEFSVDSSGTIKVIIEEYDYQLIADNVVHDTSSALPTGIHEIEDSNGDGLNEFLLVFPDQSEQLLYLMQP